jgi:hypothetical protein
MRLNKWIGRAYLIIIAITFNSCATILFGTKEKVQINSKNIKGAEIFINGVNTGKVTPATIRVKKRVTRKIRKNSRIPYVKNSQMYVLKKEGYLDFNYTDIGKYRAAPLPGNIIFGGLPGILYDASKKSPLKFRKQISGKLVKRYDPSLEHVIKPIEKNKWETYKNKVFSLEYPSSWSPSTENKMEQVMISSYIEESNTEIVVALMPINKTIYGGNFKAYFDNTVNNYKRIPTNQIVSVSFSENEGKVTYLNADNVRGTLYCKKNKDVVVNFIVVSEDKLYRAYADTLAAIMSSLKVHAADIEIVDVNSFADIRRNTTSATIDKIVISNTREKEKRTFDQRYFFNKTLGSNQTTTIAAGKEIMTLSKQKKLKKVTEDFPNLKYRRSSLYTLMINDDTRRFHSVIRDAFGNEIISTKFNDHNVGPYLINGQGGLKDQTATINAFIESNNLAKKMISRWFNRSADGGFDMNLISERGQYNASDMDIKQAKNLERGQALLSDAGEELIGNSYLIVNDYKYTDKEEVAAKANKWINVIGTVTGTEDVASLVSLGVKTAGKGYIIKTTSYLYQLEWNDSIASIFYNEYWTDDSSLDQDRVAEFNSTDLFKLKLVGIQNALADVQSSVFTEKSDEDLIAMATLKATDKAIAKLQRKYPKFQTKTPLSSVEPLTAKIGLKEGLKSRAKFEVLEQVIDQNGKTKYVRKGTVYVDKKQIWDNTGRSDESSDDNLDRTLFKGKSSGLYPGMLLRQIK